MAKSKSVADMVNEYINALTVGTTFHPRQISEHIYLITGGQRYPLDGSVGRYIRYRKEARHDVKLHDRGRSEYIKTEPTTMEDDAEDDVTVQEASDRAVHALMNSLHKNGYGLSDTARDKIIAELASALGGEE